MTPTTRVKAAFGLGFLSWLIPFAVSVVLFPIKRSNAPLFDALMAVVLVISAAWLGKHYFADLRRRSLREAVWIGCLWAAINLALDFPMFSYGPMRMSAIEYLSDIGVTYLVYPAYLVGAVSLAGARPPSA